MKLSAWTLLAAALLSVPPVESCASDNSIIEDGWGFRHSDNTGLESDMCALSVAANQNPSAEVLHIWASPGKPIVALTRGGLSTGDTVSWEVDGIQAAYFEIGEEQEMTPVSLRALAALAAGRRLLYYINDEYNDTFPLKGSSAAIDKFMECWTGSNNPRKANRVVGSAFIHGTYNDLAIMSDKQTSVAPTIRRDVYDDELSAYFVPVADDGKVVTKGYMFVFKDTEEASQLVAVSTLTRNAAGEVETAVDDQVAGSCIESDKNILCYGVGYGQIEFRLSFDKLGQSHAHSEKNAVDTATPEAAITLTKDENNPFQKDVAKAGDNPGLEDVDPPAVDSKNHRDTVGDQSALADDSVASKGYIDPNRNFIVESFGEFTDMDIQGHDLKDIAGKKLVRTVNHFTNPETHTPIGQHSETVEYKEKQGYHYEFEIKNRFDKLGQDTGTKVKFNLENLHEDGSSLRSSIISVSTISGSLLNRNLRFGGFEVEQGYCVENEPLEADTSSIKTVECKGISSKGERFGFTFVRDKEFAPKVTEWDVRKEQQAYEQTRKMLEEKERKTKENLERMRDGNF